MSLVLICVAFLLPGGLMQDNGTPAPQTPPEKTGAEFDVAAELQKAENLILAERLNDALDVLDEVERREPNLPETNFLYGRAFLKKAEKLVRKKTQGVIVRLTYEDALTYLNKASEQQPENYLAFVYLGQAHYSQNNMEKAGRAAEKAIQLNPQSSKAHLLRGEILFQSFLQAEDDKKKKDLYGKTQEALTKTTDLKPPLAAAWTQLGHLYSWGKEQEKAWEAYAVSFGLEPDPAVVSLILKNSPAAKWPGLFEKSLSASKKVRPADHRSNALLYWYLGYARFQNGMIEAAREPFAQAVELDNNYINAYYYLGKIHYAMENFLKGAESLAAFAARDPKALAQVISQTDPEPKLMKKKLSFLEATAFQNGRLGWARDLARVGTLLEPENPEKWNNWAFLCRETEQYEESYRAYLRALELDPENPRLLNDAGLILLFHLGRDLDKARAMFEKAIANARKQLKEESVDEQASQELKIALRDATNNLKLLQKHLEKKAAGEKELPQNEGEAPDGGE